MIIDTDPQFHAYLVRILIARLQDKLSLIKVKWVGQPSRKAQAGLGP